MKGLRAVAGTEIKPGKPKAWITEETIRALRVDPRPECRIPDGDKAAEGFGVRKRATKNGAYLYFNFVARLENGQTANIALGTVGVESTEEARQQARKLRKWVDRGQDPRVLLAEEQAAHRAKEAAATEAEGMTFGRAIALKLESGLREGTKKQYRALLSRDSKVSLHKLEHRRLDSISKTEWRTILKKVREKYGKHSPQPAVVRRLVAAIYRHAIAETDFLKLDNPITELRRAEFTDPKNRRKDRIEAGQLGGWFRQLHNHHPTIANLAKLYLLTGMRDREARDLTWVEIETDAIRLPPERTKTGRELLLPRTPAIDVLLGAQARQRRKSAYVFPAVLRRAGNGSGDQADRPVSSILPALRKLGCSVHGMRRTAATFMDQLGVPENIRRHVLNHAPDISRGYVVRDLAEMRKWLRSYHDWIRDQLEGDEFAEQMGEPTEEQLRTLAEDAAASDAAESVEWASKLKVS